MPQGGLVLPLLPTQLCCLGFLALLRRPDRVWAPMGGKAQDSLVRVAKGLLEGPSPATSPVGLSLAECECVCVGGVSAVPTAQPQLLVVSDE